MGNKQMILNIETGATNPLLRQKAKKVEAITPEIKGLISDMFETLESARGVGLAAPQVGRSLRIIVIKPDSTERTIALINPEIIKKSFRKETIEEGCLSLPDFYLPVKRARKIVVVGQNLQGEKVSLKTDGLLARIIQHETEHLDGILISDKKQ